MTYRMLPQAPGPVTCMTVYRDRLFCAVGNSVYELVDGVWVPMLFATLPEPTEATTGNRYGGRP